jgi:predicted  nucleic acid-binding Zn-ribbon protein
VAIDKQAQEAIERNKEIKAAEEGDFVDTSAYEEYERSKKVIQSSEEGVVKQSGRSESIVNPVVAAAKEYSDAQTKVLTSIREVDNLRLRLQQAENAYKDAEADREIKKQVLQKLVAS